MARGYNTTADLLTQTVDGRDLNAIWAEFQATVEMQNAERQPLIDLLTFPVASPIEDVPQFGAEDFEKASEFGVPRSVRSVANVLSLGYTFDWYDIANRFTWRFLSEAPAAQVEAVHQQVLDADNRLLFKGVMQTVFRSSNRAATINGQNYTVYAFWNADGTVPPAYKSNTFTGTHTHYRTSGAAALVSADLDEIINDFKSHGYSAENGTTMFAMVNVAEADIIRGFRVSAGDKFDFIPALGQPGVFLPASQQLLGAQPSSTFRGMNVIGSYGPMLIIEEDYIPAKYVVALVSGGPANIQNPVGLREHANPSMRGLMLVKGRDANYPLIDSYYARGFGTGIRQRGAGMVMQITTSSTYAAPTDYS